MNFASDNAGPVHPKVMEALAAANDGHAMAYGLDAWTERAVQAVREVFEAPEAEVFLVANGTAANALALSSLARPWDAVFCARQAHVLVDENNAIEHQSGGARLVAVGAADDRMTAEKLFEATRSYGDEDVHSPSLGPVTITNVTERGTLYSVDEMESIADVARGLGMRTHLDGARFGNAVAALGVTAAELSWKAGVDVVSFGGTKNGGMAVEAVVAFDRSLVETLERRRMRAGHLMSKARYLGAQMSALLEDGLWLELAGRANAAGARLSGGLAAMPGVEFAFPCQANMMFVRLPRAMHQRLKAAGAEYGLWEGPLDSGDPDQPLLCRLVCDWSCDDAKVDAFLDVAAG